MRCSCTRVFFFFLFPTFRSSTESPSNIGHPSSSHPSSLLPTFPHSLPLWTLISHGMGGGGEEGWRRCVLMLLAGTADTFRGARFLWPNFCLNGSECHRWLFILWWRRFAPPTRLDATRQKAGVSWSNRSPPPSNAVPFLSYTVAPVIVIHCKHNCNLAVPLLPQGRDGLERVRHRCS